MSLRPWRRRSPPVSVIWSAQGTSLSSAGVATAREPERPIAASRFSCRSVGRRSLARHTPSLRRSDVSSDGLPRQPGPQCYVPLAAPRLPAADDFRYLHSQHLLIGHPLHLVMKCGYGLRFGAQSGRMILNSWPNDLEFPSTSWPQDHDHSHSGLGWGSASSMASNSACVVAGRGGTSSAPSIRGSSPRATARR